MEITVKNSDLLTALNLVRPALDGKAGFESSHVYMRAVKGWLYLYTSNFFSQVLTKIEVTVKEEGEVLIPPQKLVDTLRTADKDLIVNLKKIDDSKIKIKTKAFSFHLSCHTGVVQTSLRIKEQFPLKDPVIAAIDLKTLMEFYKRAQFCALDTTSTGNLNALKLIFYKAGCNITATDRTIATYVNTGTEEGDQVSVMISKDEFGLLSKVFASQKDCKFTIVINAAKTMVFFSAASTVYGAKLLAGSFPDIIGLFKKSPTYTFNLPTKELLTVSQRARIFSNASHTVEIKFNATSIELTTYAEKGKDGSDFTETVELLPGSKVENLEDTKVYVDIDYILNVLGSSSATETVIGYTDTKSPIMLSEALSENNTHAQYVMVGKTKW